MLACSPESKEFNPNHNGSKTKLQNIKNRLCGSKKYPKYDSTKLNNKPDNEIFGSCLERVTFIYFKKCETIKRFKRSGWLHCIEVVCVFSISGWS